MSTINNFKIIFAQVVKFLILIEGTSKIRLLRWEGLNTKSRTEAALHEFSRESFDQIVKIIVDFPLGIMQPPLAWQYAEDTEEN